MSEIKEPETLCANCARQDVCGCDSISETDNYDMDEVYTKFRIKMKVVVWSCPD